MTDLPAESASWPRVTEIIRGAGLCGTDAAFYSPRVQAAMSKGAKVHLACQYHDEGTLDAEDLDPALTGYLAAWVNFQTAFNVKILGVELKVAHRDHHYRGTLDRLVSCDFADRAVLDLKTGSHADWHRIQLAAYRECLEDSEQYGRIAVYLKPDGTYSFKGYSEARDFREFLTCLETFRQKS